MGDQKHLPWDTEDIIPSLWCWMLSFLWHFSCGTQAVSTVHLKLQGVLSFVLSPHKFRNAYFLHVYIENEWNLQSFLLYFQYWYFCFLFTQTVNLSDIPLKLLNASRIEEFWGFYVICWCSDMKKKIVAYWWVALVINWRVMI